MVILNKIFVISGVSGVGKSSLIKTIFQEPIWHNKVLLSTSYTTRLIRPGEVDGKDYHFISIADFQNMIKNNEFIEYAKVYGNYYGTSKKFISSQLNSNKHMVIEIDWQGAVQIKNIFNKQAVLIYIKPPSWSELVNRLKSRKTDSLATIEARLAAANEEFQRISHYDFALINDDFDNTALKLKKIINDNINNKL